MYKEFRGISMSLAGAFQIPRSHKTVFEAGEFYRPAPVLLVIFRCMYENFEKPK